MAKVKVVSRHSPFYREIKVGDEIVSVNGHEIHDVLDYMYYCAAESVCMEVKRDGKSLTFTHSTDYADPGIEFDTYLMDRQRHCANKCIFCFIDQLPKNMRQTMYFKDDDFRLSLLYGNYVTLTNASEADVQRMVDLCISPLNVSVHTTDPDLRVKMLNNPKAGNILPLLRRFADAGINLRCQIVLCKGFNDGDALDRTMKDLKALYPAVSSVSVVPFGRTKFREGLCQIEVFDADDCAKVLRQINSFGDKCVEELGTRIFYPSDEFYVKAGISVPAEEFYEDFEQIENGVGMLSSFEHEFSDAVTDIKPCKKAVKLSFVSGKIMSATLPPLLEKLKQKLTGLEFSTYFITNDFFGHDITVTGLITGTDIIAQLRGRDLGDAVVIPEVMLRADKFLDDVSVSDVENALGVKVEIIPCSGAETVAALSEFVRK